MKRLTISFLLLTITYIGQSQNIKGIITDTLNSPLIAATVLLLEQDSSLLEFTQTDDKGQFIFKHINKGDYLIKTTYVGYIPATIAVKVDQVDINMPTIKMTEIAIELYEVVIKAARAPMKIKGDTIEYDATTFKVPEGSTLEDLLRRLPGVEVQQDGSLKADGQDITKLTVEGKSFFGGDPTTATKNLPAEGVSKVQVFDRKTEEQKITGDKSNTKEKEMNITLKEEYKKGGFGKVIAGAGTEDRLELKGVFNRFNDKHQFSIVGVGNNTGRNGLGWDDYQDFMGSQSFNFDDDLEYGFNSNMRYYSFGGNNDGLESSISDAFFQGNNFGGFPVSKNGGVNYNYDHNKKKLGARYFFNNNKNERTTTEDATYFFDNYTNNTSKISSTETDFKGHRAELTYEQEIDSFNTFVINGTMADVISADVNNIKEQNAQNRSSLTNDGNILNSKNFDGNLYNVSAIYRKTFRKKGRFFGINGAYKNTQVDDLYKAFSVVNFYNSNSAIDSTVMTNLNTLHVASKDGYQFNTMFNEPLSKKFFLTVFYNYNKKKQIGDINVTEPFFEFEKLVPELTRNYTNDIFYSRTGTSLRYSHSGINISGGLAYLGFNIKSHTYLASNPTEPIIVHTPFKKFIPNVNVSFEIGKNSYVGITYTKNIREPNINQMIPIVDNRNPLYISEGNPDLKPIESNAYNLYASKSWPADGIRLSINGNYNQFSSNIIMSRIVDTATQVTYSKPVNYNKGTELFSYISISFPIIKNRLKVNLGQNTTFNQNYAYVNGLLNKTNSTGLSPRINIDITPSDNFGLYISYTHRNAKTSYNINTSQNQTIKNNAISAQMNINLGKNIFVATNYSHNYYSSNRFGEDTNIPILDASIYTQFLKGKRGEIRFSLYDAFNKNRRFSQIANSNLISQSNTPSLARYLLVTFTYNIKGIKGSVEKVW